MTAFRPPLAAGSLSCRLIRIICFYVVLLCLLLISSYFYSRDVLAEKNNLDLFLIRFLDYLCSYLTENFFLAHTRTPAFFLLFYRRLCLVSKRRSYPT